MKKLLILLTLSSALSVANAAPITFYGEDASPGGLLSPTGNAATAQSDFLSNLNGVGVENFEGVAEGTLLSGGLSLDFVGSSGNITGTLSASGGGVCGGGSGSVGNIECNGYGRFATSGDNFIHTLSDSFTLSFSQGIAAFGFYGTDFGDFAGDIELSLTGGGTVQLDIPHPTNANNGNLLFFGFIDNVNTYTSISFLNTGAGSDVFGYDDMIVGDLAQISTVPEPSILALMGAGLAGFGFSRRRRLKA